MATLPQDMRSAMMEGHAARSALANDLARAFRANPTGFDPGRMERLGTEGLAAFLSAIGRTRDPMPSRVGKKAPVSADVRPPRSDTKSATSGWAHLRKPESSAWFIGVLRGVAVGTAIAGIGTLYLALVGG